MSLSVDCYLSGWHLGANNNPFLSCKELNLVEILSNGFKDLSSGLGINL